MKAALLLSIAALAGCNAAPAEISVPDAWARETVRGQTSAAAYLTVANSGGTDDRLLSVTSAVAEASLHSSTNEGGVARMRRLNDGLSIPAGETVTLAPGGNHIMLTGLREPLTAGSRVEIRLRFELSGERVAQAIVRGGADAAAAHSGH